MVVYNVKLGYRWDENSKKSQHDAYAYHLVILCLQRLAGYLGVGGQLQGLKYFTVRT